MTPAVLERTQPIFAPSRTYPLIPFTPRDRELADPIDIRRKRPIARPEPVADEQVERKEQVITDRDELGRRIAMAAVSGHPSQFAVACRSTLNTTRFATPLRSLLLTLGSGFDGISVTISPNLLLHTYPAMQALVKHLESEGYQAPWMPVGERAIGLGTAKHMFVSHDTPVKHDPHSFKPNLLLEIVAAHLIPASWFDAVVAPKCELDRLTIVCYGVVGVNGSLFERVWNQSDTRGLLTPQ